MTSFYGFEVYAAPEMVDWKQVKFPRSKKRRIRKKWAKNPKYYRSTPSASIYQVGRRLYAHSSMIERIKRATEEATDRRTRSSSTLAQVSGVWN